MSKNKASKPFISDYKQVRKGQGQHHAHWYRGRHRVVMLPERVSAFTASSASSVSTWTDIDFSGFTSTGTGDISDDTIALIVFTNFRDSASSGNHTYFRMRPNGATGNAGYFVVVGSHINSINGSSQDIIPLDEDYIAEYTLQASGSGTANLELYIVGYIEQIS